MKNRERDREQKKAIQFCCRHTHTHTPKIISFVCIVCFCSTFCASKPICANVLLLFVSLEQTNFRLLVFSICKLKRLSVMIDCICEKNKQHITLCARYWKVSFFGLNIFDDCINTTTYHNHCRPRLFPSYISIPSSHHFFFALLILLFTLCSPLHLSLALTLLLATVHYILDVMYL